MYKKKKGIALVECIAYISIFVILSAILIKVVFCTDYLYLKDVKRNLSKSDINDFFTNIERFLDDDKVKKVEVKNGNLIIYKQLSKDQIQKAEIYKEKDKIKIKYFVIGNFEEYHNYNTLDEKVEDFKVIVKGKIIYLVVKKGGGEYIRCL